MARFGAEQPDPLYLTALAAGNVGTGLDLLGSCAIPEGLLDRDGDGVQVVVAVSFAANDNQKRLRLQFAGTTVWETDAAAQDIDSGQIVARLDIVRTASGAQLVVGTVMATTTGTFTVGSQAVYVTTADAGNGGLFTVQGEGTADNDVVLRLLRDQQLPNQR